MSSKESAKKIQHSFHCTDDWWTISLNFFLCNTYFVETMLPWAHLGWQQLYNYPSLAAYSNVMLKLLSQPLPGIVPSLAPAASPDIPQPAAPRPTADWSNAGSSIIRPNHWIQLHHESPVFFSWSITIYYLWLKLTVIMMMIVMLV